MVSRVARYEYEPIRAYDGYRITELPDNFDRNVFYIFEKEDGLRSTGQREYRVFRRFDLGDRESNDAMDESLKALAAFDPENLPQ